jgi:hypothetical protein
MKIDLHVHSKYSVRPSQWVLQKLGCHECYTEPVRLYEIARKRGMDWVTITDHNTIAGCLDIAHLPKTFISEEITAYFPEDRCKIHVLAYQITEAQHRDIQKYRDDIYELVEYLRQEDIPHTLAHPLWSVNNRLNATHFEKLLLLFKNVEINGSRDVRLNEYLKEILVGLTPEFIDNLAEKYHLYPMFPEPWVKHITGGSDDHNSLNIARLHTQRRAGLNSMPFFFLTKSQETLEKILIVGALGAPGRAHDAQGLLGADGRPPGAQGGHGFIAVQHPQNPGPGMNLIALQTQRVAGAVGAFVMLPDHEHNFFRKLKRFDKVRPPVRMSLDFFPVLVG